MEQVGSGKPDSGSGDNPDNEPDRKTADKVDGVHKSQGEVGDVLEYKCRVPGCDYTNTSLESIIQHSTRKHGSKVAWNEGKEVKEDLSKEMEKSSSKDGGSGGIDLEKGEGEDPNTILKGIFGKYRGSKTFDTDVKEYILDVALDAEYLSPGELRSQLLEMQVDPRVTNKIFRLYDLKFRRWWDKQKLEGYEANIDNKLSYALPSSKIPVAYKEHQMRRRVAEEEESEEPWISMKRKPKKSYKYVVDGQLFETYDPDEYFAWKRYEEERKEREERRGRENEAHERAMRKLDEEIKRIVAESTTVSRGGEEEDLVPIQLDEGVSVNVSHRDYLLWHLSRGTKDEGEKVPVEIAGQNVNVPPMVAAMLEMKRLETESRGGKLEEEVTFLRDRNRALTGQIEDILNGRTSIQATGQTLTDVIDKRMKEGHDIMKTFVNRLPMHEGEGQGLNYEAERSIDERRRLADKINSDLERGKEKIEAENELVSFMRVHK